MVVTNLYIDKVHSSSSSKNGRILQWLATSFLFLLVLVLVTSAVADEELVCQKGVRGFPGATFPRGDILLKEGDTLEVYCRLDMRKTPYNASFIKFYFTKANNISEAMMKTTVINETTALLQVERMNASSPHLSCEIAPPGLRRVQVCQNEIDVGFPPLPVGNFRCIAQEWQSLNCTWTKPYNPIPTNYALQLLQKGKSFNSIIFCPNTTATPTSCTWGGRTEPFYRQNLNPLIFRMNGTNPLDPNGTSWDYSIDHWSIVVPEAPTDLRTHPSSPDVVTVAWAFKSFKDFVPGLVHQVTVCIQNFTVPCNVTKLNSYKGSGHLELNIPLDYAYVNYTVEIRMRSSRAKDEPTFWSKPSVIVVPSEAKNPTAPPKVDIGSYESVTVSDKKRDIYVYWEELPPLFRNGPGFNYILTLQEDEELKPEIEPKEITRSYAKYTGLWLNRSYRFHIVSANQVGNSSSASLVYVPKIPKAPLPPTAVSKFDFTNGSFVVSWSPVAEPSVPILSYTVFRCLSTRARPYQCQGLVKWDIVGAGKQSKLYDYLPHDNITYQFAVAANAESMSSGMAWATCTLIHGKVPGKLTKVAKSEGEKEIRIDWQLDCSYKPGVIDGYKISYCRVEGGQNKSDHCTNDVIQEAVSGANITSYYLKKLQPCSTYKISVSIISSNGESQKSDPIYATTKPSAPSNPPIATVVRVTNTSAVISILPQAPLNGIVKEYRIKYKSLETGETVEKSYPVVDEHPQRSSSDERTADSCVDDGTLINQTDVEIRNLLSSSNYTFTVVACTSKCSEDSTLVSFKTDVGFTDMTAFPNININGEDIIVEWGVPPRIRGPISEFEILLKQVGKVDEIVSVPYDSGSNATRYHHRMQFSCETNTNLTAQVRTLTLLDTNEILYGRWSPAGNFNCGGGASWIIWVAVVIGVILIIVLIGCVSTKAYKHLKEMKEVNVKLPPGMAVQDLNGFSHSHPKRRRDSDRDTQSFGKENLTYQMTTTHHSDDSKDFASLTESCLQQESSAGFVQHGEMSFDNKVYSEELEGIPLKMTKSIHTSGPSSGIQLLHSTTVDTSLIASTSTTQPPNVENESLLIEKRLSPSSPTNPLLHDSLTVEEEEPPTPLQSSEMYSNVQNIFNGLSFGRDDSRSDNGSPTPFSTSPYPPGSAEDSPASSRAPDILPGVPNPTTSSNNNAVFGGPSSNNSSNNPGGGVLNPPPPLPQPNPGSSYVKWTQMLPDQFINGDVPLGGIDNGHKTPYCQVGILLDSN